MLSTKNLRSYVSVSESYHAFALPWHMAYLWSLSSRVVLGTQELPSGPPLLPSILRHLGSIPLFRGPMPTSGENIKMSSHLFHFYEALFSLRKKLSGHLWLLHRWLPPTHRVQS